MANRHLIGKQVILLEVNAFNDSDTIHQKMSELYWNAVVPELNKLFDTLVGENEIVRLDSIELDIGNISLNKNFETEIVDKIIQRLKENLFRYQNDPNHIFPTEYHPKLSTTQRPLREHYFDIWLHWLERGDLPSYSTTPEKNWLELVFETLGLHAKAVDRLQGLLLNAPVALERLILQHSKEELRTIVELHTGFPQSGLLKILDELKLFSKESRISLSTIEFRAIEISIWKQILTLVILKKEKHESLAFAAHISKISSVKKLLQQIETIEKLKYPILTEIIKTEKKNRKAEKENREIESVQAKKQRAEIPDLEVIDNTLDDIIDEVFMKTPQFFKNAGVILLHPFLPTFFKQLDLLNGSAFKNANSQSRAVLLLHFLATGNEKAPEYEMLLPKFLCGMPINLPIDHTLLISEAEKEEANSVLVVALEHWGALGSTSPEGLQDGFLRREGKLLKEQSGWKLYVEQKTIDILLDKLPWNLSMIKLPWMNELLKVEWR